MVIEREQNLYMFKLQGADIVNKEVHVSCY